MDDLFQVILSTNRPVPLAVKYFFDLLDEQALHYGISDPETIHIWKTNRYSDNYLCLLKRRKIGVARQQSVVCKAGFAGRAKLGDAVMCGISFSTAAAAFADTPLHFCLLSSLPLRFWINIIKNPQFVFDVQTSDNVDAVLLVIAQTFMDSCTIADHKLGRVSMEGEGGCHWHKYLSSAAPGRR